MRYTENIYFRVEYFDDPIYTAESNIVTIECKTDDVRKARLADANGNKLATYIADADGYIRIDLTDYLRVHAGDNLVYIYHPTDNISRLSLRWTSTKLYDVTKIIHKPSIYMQRMNYIDPTAYDDIRAIVPPCGLVSSTGVEAFEFVLPIIGIDLQNVDIQASYEGFGVFPVEASVRGYIRVPVWLGRPLQRTKHRLIGIQLHSKIEDEYAEIPVAEATLCNKQYALIRWVFPNGDIAVTTTELRNVTDVVTESVSLRTLDGSFNTSKGVGQNAKLYWENLTAYDVWFFGTIATSPMVELTTDGEEWKQIDVTTKKVEHPVSDEGKLHTLTLDVSITKHTAQ